MTALLPGALILLVTALAGPALVRRGAPLLMHVPRAGTALLLAGPVAWLLTVAAGSIALAGMLAGPRLLPGPYADVCQRCLAAANPFPSGSQIETGVPIIVLVLAPLLAALALAGAAVVRMLRRARSTRAVLEEVLIEAEETQVAGHRVLMIPDPHPRVFALPRRRGGIVVSRGLVDALTPTELTAVLEHEHAHLRQHHHLLLALLHDIAGPLRVVPLISSTLTAVPHFLEIAADDAARRRCGTPAIAAALLKLGSRGPASAAAEPVGSLLHATGPPGSGPDRIGHLVTPAGSWPALVPAASLAVLVTALGAISVVVLGPLATVLLGGCALPP